MLTLNNLLTIHSYKFVIVMSVPGEGIHALYRNKIEDVVDLLHSKHGNKYIVFNLSTEIYDFNKFDNQVLEFGWPDHTAPPLERLCRYNVCCCKFNIQSLSLRYCFYYCI